MSNSFLPQVSTLIKVLLLILTFDLSEKLSSKLELFVWCTGSYAAATKCSVCAAVSVNKMILLT